MRYFIAQVAHLFAYLPGTRRVAMYLETGDTAIQARTERFPPAYSTGDTTVYLFTDAQAV